MSSAQPITGATKVTRGCLEGVFTVVWEGQRLPVAEVHSQVYSSGCSLEDLVHQSHANGVSLDSAFYHSAASERGGSLALDRIWLQMSKREIGVDAFSLRGAGWSDGVRQRLKPWWTCAHNPRASISARQAPRNRCQPAPRCPRRAAWDKRSS